MIESLCYYAKVAVANTSHSVEVLSIAVNDILWAGPWLMLQLHNAINV